MNPKESSSSTLCAFAAVAFVVACVAHEAIGHGGACLATGGTIDLLTSVYFHCSPGRPFVDAAGPLMNLVFAAAAAGGLALSGPANPLRPFLALVLAFNGFWGGGYFIFSSITNTGDWAFVLRDLALNPLWFWRFAMAVAGVSLYGATLRGIAIHLPRGRPLVAAYLAAGAVACISTIFYAGPIFPALQEAAQESLLAAIGLLYLAIRPSRIGPSTAPVLIRRSHLVLFLSALIVLVFWLVQGRGLARSQVQAAASSGHALTFVSNGFRTGKDPRLMTS